MKKILFFLSALLPGLGFAQDCFKPFSTNCWFSSNQFVRITADGSRFLVASGSGPTGNTNTTSCATATTSIMVYDVTNGGIVYNSTASTGGLGGFGSNYEVSDFTANKGYFYTINTSGNSFSINFKQANGTNHNLGTFTHPHHFEKVTGAPNKMIIKLSSNNQAVILDASPLDNPSPTSPTATTVVLPGAANNASDGNIRPIAVASETDDRIYYVATEDEGSTLDPPYYRVKIKACTMAGVPATGWTDAIIHRGQPYEMAIRPTDRRIFIRTNPAGNHLDFHGMVVLNKDGSVPTDMNMADLSITGNPTGSQSGDRRDLGFDANGNIYANLYHFVQGPNTSVIAYGMMKFDPTGNLDLGFLRNQWNTYGQAAGGAASSFDITDAGVIIKCTYGTSNGNEGAYALSPAHINANNEDPNITYAYLPSYTPLFQGQGSNYQYVQFLFNNGRLIMPSMDQAAINSRCGLATPLTIPQTTAAVGTINCSKTAFIAAPVVGTPSSIAIRVEINVTAVGTFSPITLSGSGFSLPDPNYTIEATTTGIQTFMIPARYDGSALTTMDIGAGQAGTCQAAFAANPTYKKKVEVEIWTSENCTFTQVGPVLK